MSHPIADHVRDAAVTHSGTTVMSYATSGASVLTGALTMNQWCMLIGTLCAVGTFLVNWWYKHQEHRRAEQLAAAKMRNANRSAAPL